MTSKDDPASAASVAKGAVQKEGPPKEPAAKKAEPTGESVRVVPGIARYHNADCLLIRFLADEDLEIISRATAAAEGYMACKACKPDQVITS